MGTNGMNKNVPERYSVVSPEALSRRHYFASLVENAHVAGLLTERDMERIQGELLELLAKQIDRYNNGDSSSIRVEKAQVLTDSILFTLGVSLKSLSVAEGIDAVKDTGLNRLFLDGQRKITRKTNVCRLSHRSLVKNLFETPNEFYSSTVIDGIRGFFKCYSPEYAAHEISITADYPTLMGEEDLCGIEFIENYLHNLFYENLFLKQFSPETVNGFLRRYDPGFAGIPMNLCEPVLNTALCCVLCGKDPMELSPSPEDCNTVEQLLSDKDRDGLHYLLSHSLITLCHQIKADESLSTYLTNCLPNLLPTWENGVKCGTLPHLFGVKMP